MRSKSCYSVLPVRKLHIIFFCVNIVISGLRIWHFLGQSTQKAEGRASNGAHSAVKSNSLSILQSKNTLQRCKELEKACFDLCEILLTSDELVGERTVLSNRCEFVKDTLYQMKRQAKHGDVTNIGKAYFHSKARLILRSVKHIQLYLHYKSLRKTTAMIESQILTIIILSEDALEETYQMQEKIFNDVKLKIIKDILKRQYPSECKNDPTILCAFPSKATGFGTRIEKVAYCLNAGLESKRRVVLVNPEKHFLTQPFFNKFWSSCRYAELQDVSSVPVWLSNSTAETNVELRIDGKNLERHNPKGFWPYLKDSVFQPENPWAWYSGVLHLIAMQLAPHYERLVRARMTFVGLNMPYVGYNAVNKHLMREYIAGIHVRRFDKDTLLPHQPLEKYMTLVENFFRKLDLRHNEQVPRKVFIATDDEAVIREAIESYPNYKILANSSVASNANGDNHNIFKPGTQEDVITDFLILTAVDFLVCTYSSHLGKTVYALRSALDPRAADTTVSLDRNFRLDGWSPDTYVALRDHRVPGELTVSKGDLIRTGMIASALQTLASDSEPYPTHGLAFGYRLPNNTGEWYPKVITRYYMPWLEDPTSD